MLRVCLRPQRTVAARLGARSTARWLSDDGAPKKKETLWEKNTRLREASEANLERTRRVLLDDASQHKHDIGSLRTMIHEKQVTLHAPPAALYSQNDAFRFPELDVEPLQGAATVLSEVGLFGGKLTLLGCSGNQLAQPMVDGWLDGVAALLPPPAADAPAPPLLQQYRLSMVEDKIVRLLRWPLLASMRMSVPKEQQPTFLTFFGDGAAHRAQLRMENRYSGYVCLVDSRGIVRWHVHGTAQPSEAEVGALAALIEREVTAMRRAGKGAAARRAS